MGCCGCADDSSTKTPENEEMASNNGDQIFVRSRDRSCTDPLALLILVLLVGGFGFLMNTAIKKGDIYRIVYGYDDCANVCGRITPTETNPLFSCKGADKRKEPYLWLEIEGDGVKSRQCVANCSIAPDRILFLNRCLPKTVTGPASSVIRKLGLDSFFREVTMDLNSCWHELIHLLLIALGISICILIAFRYIVQWVVYIVLIGVIIACISGTTFFWLIWHGEKKLVEKGEVHPEDSHVQPYFIYAVTMTVVTVITVLIVLVMRKRIALVMQLFRETGKAVYSMPALLFQPILTYILIGCAMAAWVYCMLWIESAGDLYKNRKNHFHYKKDAMLISLRWYNLFLFFVACEFFLGCQHMVIATAVAQWFFTRDKRRLSLPVVRGFGYLLRFHLGTVAFGAMVIGVVRLVRSMLAWIQNRLKRYENDFVKGILWCCQCCLWCFECALKFLTRNAYIETAIYGCNFCTGGQRAFKALASNILRVAAINSVGDFVLFLGKVLVVVLTCVIGVYMIEKKAGLHHPWVPIAIAGVLAFVVAHCFISVYEMIIDTIFICFCEDCEKNDGINRPYFMSRGLMEFVENSKKALRHLDESS